MIARAAQGNPWIFQQINYYLEHGTPLNPPDNAERQAVIFQHLQALYDFYGEYQGLRIARKHIGWYLKTQLGGELIRRQLVRVESARQQIDLLASWFAEGPQAKAA
jgi:tRNA-dihydrouridine synthase B